MWISGDDCSVEVAEELNLLPPKMITVCYAFAAINYGIMFGCAYWNRLQLYGLNTLTPSLSGVRNIIQLLLSQHFSSMASALGTMARTLVATWTLPPSKIFRLPWAGSRFLKEVPGWADKLSNNGITPVLATGTRATDG